MLIACLDDRVHSVEWKDWTRVASCASQEEVKG